MATSFSYQWRRDGVDIAGEQSQSYTTVLADQGHPVDCLVTATNVVGSTDVATNSVAVLAPGQAVPITQITYGTPWKYNSQHPARWIIADVWSTTWADDDELYTMQDDSFSWGAMTPTANVAVSHLSDWRPNMIVGTIRSMMPEWGIVGATGSDGATFKGCGMISVNGTLYMGMSRHIYGNWQTGLGTAARQIGMNATIIKSIDHGVNWTPIPPTTAQPYSHPPVAPLPMFPGIAFGNPYFVHYGQDTVGQTIHRSDEFLYGVSNNGWWNNGDSMILGRSLLTKLPDQDPDDWEFWQGGDGLLDTNWGPITSAQTILFNPLKVSMQGIQYIAPLRQYVMVQWWHTSIVNNTLYDPGDTQWDFYTAPFPWGPWKLIDRVRWNAPVGTPGRGFYNPCVIPKSISSNGLEAMIITCGDHTSQHPATGDYTLTLVPFTLSIGLPTKIPDNLASPVITTGTIAIGGVLSCSTGEWSRSPTFFHYQWRRNGTNLPAELNTTYTLVAADEGQLIDCVVRATNNIGISEGVASEGIFVAIPGATKWNPADAHPDILFANNDTSIYNQIDVIGYWPGCRSLGTTHTTGKVYFEARTGDPIAGGSMRFQLGFANSSASISMYVGNGANSVGLIVGNVTNVVVSDSNIAVPALIFGAAPPGGWVIGVAIDFTAGLIWFTQTGSIWNSGGGTPDAGTGGISFTAAPGPYMILGGVGGSGLMANSLTLRTVVPFVHPLPLGFLPWD